MKHIFTVDDDKEIRFLIKKYLEKEGFKVTDFSDPLNVLSEVKRLHPDLIILDISMPGLDGIELCKKIRKESDVPIVFVSARGEEVDRIIGLEVGGDDYLPKPFSPRELLARIKNIFRRLEKTEKVPETQLKIEVKNLQVFLEQRQVVVNGTEISLTMKEFEVLQLLLENHNRAFTRLQLLEKIWGYDSEGESRIVDDVIKRLRKKLSSVGSEVEIITVWGYGYKSE